MKTITENPDRPDRWSKEDLKIFLAIEVLGCKHENGCLYATDGTWIPEGEYDPFTNYKHLKQLIGAMLDGRRVDGVHRYYYFQMYAERTWEGTSTPFMAKFRDVNGKWSTYQTDDDLSLAVCLAAAKAMLKIYS